MRRLLAVPAAAAALWLAVTTASAPTPTRLAVLTFLALALLVILLGWPGRGAPTDRRDRVLAAYAAGPANGGARPASVHPSPLGTARAGALAATARLLGGRGRNTELALRLNRAGLTLLPHEWVALRLGAMAVGGVVLALLLPVHRLGLPLGAALAWFGAQAWLRWRQSQRCRAFADQLPDILQVVAGGLRSGFALAQALATAQQNALEPMASELGRALAGARVGADLTDELDAIAVRMRSEEWRLAVMAMRIQHSVGGSLAEVLTRTAATLRERAALFRQVRALSAEGRLSAYVLMLLPIVLGGFMAAFRRTYVEVLWTTRPGLVLVAGGAVGMVVGAFWMFRIATVDV